MAYSPPPGGTVSFTLPAQSYTPPASDDIDFIVGEVTAFARSVQASGFSSTQHGTPIAHATATRQVATLGHVTHFGTPLTPRLIATGSRDTKFGTPDGRRYSASGWVGTQFGTPWDAHYWVAGFADTRFGNTVALYVPSLVVAPGFNTTQFGTPATANIFQVRNFSTSTRFSTAYTPVVQATLPKGFLSGRFGQHQLAPTFNAGANKILSATGFKSAQFGEASVQGVATQSVTGFEASVLGVPIARTAHGAQGWISSVFGTTSAHAGANLTGFKSTSFGTPMNRLTLIASSTRRVVRWGLPTSGVEGTFKVYSIKKLSLFAKPKAFNRFNYPVTGFTSTQFGVHSGVDQHYACMTSPGTTFSQPLLKRNVLC